MNFLKQASKYIVEKCLSKSCQTVIVRGSENPELQSKLDSLGICNKELTLECGPWSSCILRNSSQEIALGPQLRSQLLMQIIE